MKKENYSYDGKTISLIVVNYLFSTRYRRSVFDDTQLKSYFVNCVREVCEENSIEIVNLLCEKYFVYLTLKSSPNLSPSLVMYRIKTHTSKKMRERFDELNHLNSLFTKPFVASTEEIPKEVAIDFLESQKFNK